MAQQAWTHTVNAAAALEVQQYAVPAFENDGGSFSWCLLIIVIIS